MKLIDKAFGKVVWTHSRVGYAQRKIKVAFAPQGPHDSGDRKLPGSAPSQGSMERLNRKLVSPGLDDKDGTMISKSPPICKVQTSPPFPDVLFALDGCPLSFPIFKPPS